MTYVGVPSAGRVVQALVLALILSILAAVFWEVHSSITVERMRWTVGTGILLIGFPLDVWRYHKENKTDL